MEEIEELRNELQEIKTLILSLNSSFQISKSPYSLLDWLYKFIEAEKNIVSEKTRQLYFSDIKKYIEPNLKDNKSISEYIKLDILEILNKVPTLRTKRDVYNLLNGAFRSAYENNIISSNIMISVKQPVQETKKGRALTLKEQKQFLNSIKNSRYENAYKLYLLTGCRKSELFSIKWNDIDYRNNLIHIPGTKTKLSDRYIPLFPQIKVILREMKVNSKSEYIFDFSMNALSLDFKRLKKKKNFTFCMHSLRHTFATRCLEKGISLKVVQKWLGHSRLDMTSNVYTHVLNDFEKKESHKFSIKFE